MPGRVSSSFDLVKASARVLQADKELLVFPLLSMVACILVATTFFLPAFLLGWTEALGDGGVLASSFGFLFYLTQYTVVFFFNTALVGAALIRLEGGDPTVSDGFRIAFDRFGAIVEYAALAATVGMVLRFLSERAGPLGRLVSGFLGLSWGLATYLVVPVLVTKHLGPIDAVKESASLFKRTWGEQVIGNVGMGLAFFLMFLSFSLFAVPLIVLGAKVGPTLLVPVVLVVLAGFMILALTSAALRGIYQAALFRFATTGEPGWGFDPDLMSQSFRPK